VTLDELLVKFTKNGIGVGVHYLSILEHPFYRGKYNMQELEHAVSYGRRTISLPLSPKLTEEDVNRIITVCNHLITG
jgi:dTDP-4-amino-4,6-dideoxygalactose transaminase